MSERNDILAVKDCRVELVEGLPDGWPTVYVRELSGRECGHLKANIKERGDDDPLMPGYVASVFLCDASGMPTFTDADVEALSAKSMAALSTIADAAFGLNGLTGDAVEEHAKN